MARITGRDRLRYVLKQLPPAVRRKIRDGTLAAAQETADFQKRLAPVKTGKLRDSIVVTPGDKNLPGYAYKPHPGQIHDPFLSAIISAGNRSVRYAHLVEFGTHAHINKGEFPGTENPGMHAEPFFIPGYRATRKSAQARINRAARQGIKDGLK
jgi:HK97 gp10 family phage protein